MDLEPEEDTYGDSEKKFFTDYDRENPITRKKAM
jgi:hypothetical protein